jgi:hypothetical protein
VNAQTGAIDAVEFDLKAAAGLGPGGLWREFDKARCGRGHDLLVMERDVMCEVRPAQPQVLGHARGRQRRGQVHSLIPEGLGNSFAGVSTALTPAFKLPRELVELVFGV